MKLFITKHKKLSIIVCILIAIIIFIGCDIYISNNVLTVYPYEVDSKKIDNSFSFVTIADLHNKEFGKDNQKLLDKIDSLNPDFVALVGDFVTLTKKTDKVAMKFINEISKRHTCFFVYGNHELAYYDKKQLDKDLKNTGVTILDNEMTQYTTKTGETITIGGLTDFPHLKTEFFKSDSKSFYQKFLSQNDDKHFSLLLCHYPDYFMYGLDEDTLDLMVSGHAHGGLVRLPFIGGLYAPEQGFFPTYDKGYFEKNNSHMIITAGLSNSNALPRLNNPPDITYITIT